MPKVLPRSVLSFGSKRELVFIYFVITAYANLFTLPSLMAMSSVQVFLPALSFSKDLAMGILRGQHLDSNSPVFGRRVVMMMVNVLQIGRYFFYLY